MRFALEFLAKACRLLVAVNCASPLDFLAESLEIGFTGGKIFGSLGFPSIATLGLKKLNDMPCLKCINAEKLGNDVLHTWIVERDNSILEGL